MTLNNDFQNMVDDLVEKETTIFLRWLTRNFKDKTYLKEYFELENSFLEVSISNDYPNSFDVCININYCDRNEVLDENIINFFSQFNNVETFSVPRVYDKYFTLTVKDNYNSLLEWFMENDCSLPKTNDDFIIDW